MPATPAWPPRSTPRLFVDRPLAAGADVHITGNAAHYLLNVMRLGEGDPVKLCDDATGEYLAIIAHRGKRDLVLTVEGQLREREQVPDIWLCIAPVKKPHFDLMIEKATELGAARIVPVLTRRCVVDKVNEDRTRTIMVEAAEQCARTALPSLAQLVPLAKLLADWPAERALFMADETGGMPAANAFADAGTPAAILIGPEGGFDDTERAMLHAHAATRAVALGPRILRAETAAVAALALWMAVAGDWRG